MTLTRVATEINQRKRKNATNPHLNTPQKARIRQAYTDRKEMNYYGLRSRNHSFKAAYEALGVSKTSAYRTIREARPSDVDRTIHTRQTWMSPVDGLGLLPLQRSMKWNELLRNLMR